MKILLNSVVMKSDVFNNSWPPLELHETEYWSLGASNLTRIGCSNATSLELAARSERGFLQSSQLEGVEFVVHKSFNVYLKVGILLSIRIGLHGTPSVHLLPPNDISLHQNNMSNWRRPGFVPHTCQMKEICQNVTLFSVQRVGEALAGRPVCPS